MDRPNNQPATAQGQTPAHRDMMFCHECADEWYRDQHGLTCPECGSDFTEVIEEGNDPRDSAMFADDDDGEDDEDSMPDLEDAHGHAADPRHNPWANDDPAEEDISNVRFTQTAPGRFHVNATITRSMSPQEYRAGGMAAMGPMGGFMSLLNGITSNAARQAQQQPGQDQNQNQNQSAFQEARNQGQQPQQPAGGPRVSRFTYTGGAQMNPNHEDMTNVIAGLMANFGAAPPGGMHGHPGHGPRVEVHVGGGPPHAHAHDHAHAHGMPPNPIFDLFQSIGIVPPNTSMGDFVSSQEGLDRIISQLMEQTATSNAPGPATQSDIDALPRKKVDAEMLGAEYKAECSICMDEVNIEEEVTVLPCNHWFHHACVSAWLLEHDTCPHCRKGITRRQEGAQQSEPATSGSRTIPGAFDLSGAGTPPWVAPHASSPPPPNTSDNGTQTGNGGISDRIRRGVWGPPQ